MDPWPRRERTTYHLRPSFTWVTRIEGDRDGSRVLHPGRVERLLERTRTMHRLERWIEGADRLPLTLVAAPRRTGSLRGGEGPASLPARGDDHTLARVPPPPSPVPRTFRREGGPAPRDEQEEGRRATAHPPESWNGARAASAPKTLPEAEIHRLADRVLRTMDERLIAHRERRGRI